VTNLFDARPAEERALLGAIMLEPSVFPMADLRAEDFTEPWNATIFRHMQAIDRAGEPVTEANLVERMDSDGSLERIGGGYLGELSDFADPKQVMAYVAAIKDASDLRKLREKARNVVEDTALPLKEFRARLSVLASDPGNSSRTFFQPPAWPEPLAREAFHGLTGEVVRTIEPNSEADPAALLLQFLAAFGNVVGRGPHFRAEADRHGLNLFSALVGTTSKARKGTSWGHIHRLFAMADIQWAENCLQSGLSSGEGLIYAVRDTAGDDPGVADKRLLVMESEFASALRVLGRDGNTLSALLRRSWDGGTLQSLTKQSPMKATDPHISVVAHVTKDELLRELKRTEQGNGFANRFLWGCVHRSKVLPEGGSLPEDELAILGRQLKARVDIAHSLGDCQLRRDDDARAEWCRVYRDLSEGKPGLLGAVTSRAEAQVMRLACLYALLDMSDIVRPEHLRAALAVWKYCEASARFIFGNAMGDPVADELLALLRKSPVGLTRTEISSALGRNRVASDITRALTLLAEHGLAISKAEPTNGRDAERWQAMCQSTSSATTGGPAISANHLNSSNSFNSYSALSVDGR
jgi:hypothetical protein